MKVEMLLGGITRFATIEALANAVKPVTAHHIALTKGLDPAATYRCLAELSYFGIVKSRRGVRNQTFYRLSAGPGRAAAVFLRSLKKKTESTDLEKWLSSKMRAERMEKIIMTGKPKKSAFANLDGKSTFEGMISKRMPGKLSALVMSSKAAFNQMFAQKDGMFTMRI